MFKQITVLSLLMVLFSACDKDKFNAEIPSYIHIESIEVETLSFEGSNSDKITDAWITMDGQYLGAFELPCTVPVLAEGEHVFTIYAGIKANGISAIRMKYPFYSKCDLYINQGEDYVLAEEYRVNLTKDSLVSLKAITHYKENVNFLLLEDFEDAGSLFEASEDSDTSLVRVNTEDLVFEGAGSGAIFMADSVDFFELITSEYYEIPHLYNNTFLELNYRCNHPFKIGLQVRSDLGVNQYESLTINPSEEWNKVYVYMTEQLVLANSQDEFGLFIGMPKDPTMEKEAYFYFDNIKWLQEQ